MKFFRFLVRIFRPSRPRRREQWPPLFGPSPRRRRQPVRYAETGPVPPPQAQRTVPNVPVALRGTCWVIDGDTIVIDGFHIRLAGIDAPELDHPWGQKAKWEMVRLCKGQVITAHILPELSYDRVVAQCYLPDGRDLAAELVRAGLALDWPKFSRGAYKHLEPPGVRKKLWMATARQRGAWRTQVDD